MVTIKDISKETGFSTTTVSRALNGYLDVNENTRAKIQTVAERLGYTPNMLARSLVMKQSKTIGFLITDLKRSSRKDNFLFEALCGTMDQLHEMEYEGVVLTTTSSKQKNKTYSQLCNERNLDGVIIVGLKTDDPYLQEAETSSKPCVMVDIPTSAPNTGYVTSNQTESAKQAVLYLHRQGHKHIAMMNGYQAADVSTKRLEGYRKALEECGVTYKEEYIRDGQFEEDKAKQAAISLLLSYPEITAIFCASDVMALGVMKAAKELNIVVPDQLSIIGFDNILLTEYVTPSLTTIGQNPYEMGKKAAEMLIGIIEDKETNRVVELQNELIVRGSTAPPPKENSPTGSHFSQRR